MTPRKEQRGSEGAAALPPGSCRIRAGFGNRLALVIARIDAHRLPWARPATMNGRPFEEQRPTRVLAFARDAFAVTYYTGRGRRDLGARGTTTALPCGPYGSTRFGSTRRPGCSVARSRHVDRTGKHLNRELVDGGACTRVFQGERPLRHKRRASR